MLKVGHFFHLGHLSLVQIGSSGVGAEGFRDVNLRVPWDRSEPKLVTVSPEPDDF